MVVLKSEYHDGKIVMMAGSTSAALIPNDLKVRSSPTQYVYLDLTVICGDLETDDADPHVAPNPRLIVEVASPSTYRHDRMFKWLRYQFLSSLTDYLRVDQDQLVVEISGVTGTATGGTAFIKSEMLSWSFLP